MRNMDVYFSVHFLYCFCDGLLF